MLDFLTKYFAVLSAVAVAAGSSFVVIFVFGYLAVFDWNLIWIIEYQDIAKFTLVGVAIGITVLPQLLNFASITHNMALAGPKFKRILTIIFLAIIILIAIEDVWTAYHHEDSAIEYHVYLQLTLFGTIGIGMLLVKIAPEWMTKTKFQQIQFIGAMLIFCPDRLTNLGLIRKGY